MFFFEKKNQKTFTLGARLAGSARKGTKVFWFFFSKKNILLLWFGSTCRPALSAVLVPRHSPAFSTP